MTLTQIPLTERTSDPLADFPVVVIGAGPIGLAAAAQLLERGIEPLVLEAGEGPGAAVRQWGHIRLFTPWEHLVDEAALRLLDSEDWEAPAAHRMPTGQEFVEKYLVPLASTAALAPRIRYGAQVTGVTRRGMDRTRSLRRERTPFLVRTSADGQRNDVLARAVIDASGTYSTSNAVTSNGLGVTSPAEVAPYISHALPDVLGRERDRFAGRRVVVVGAGHSAANTLIALAELRKADPRTSITWLIRGVTPTRVYGSTVDELPARGSLGAAVKRLVDDGLVTLENRFEVDDVVGAGDGSGAVIAGRRGDGTVSIEADVIVNATGFRPDLSALREIRLSLDEIVEAPAQLAPLIDPNLHSCGTVYPHGVAQLAHPEKDFYIAGMKSYGRAPTFLLKTGYEQVRSIADDLAGHHDAARLVQLVLPETGVCSTGASDESGSSCC